MRRELVSVLFASVLICCGPAKSGRGAACDLTGDYRLRFQTSERDTSWMRVTGTPAASKTELLAPVAALGLDTRVSPELAAHRASCTLNVAMTGELGRITAALTLDPTKGHVAGTLVRAAPRDAFEEGPTPLVGVRDIGAPRTPACLVPGVYRLSVPDGFDWATREGRSGRCEWTKEGISVLVRIEPFGDTIVIHQLEEADEKEASAGMATVTAEGACSLKVAICTTLHSIDARRELAGDSIRARASQVRLHVDTDGDGSWTCGVDDVPLTVERVKTAPVPRGRR
jgi:hypothetical protein